uniref:GG19862 n=1 Tax=Drosophila erecta TaxID=7220 RepID=B3P3Y9_DROER
MLGKLDNGMRKTPVTKLLFTLETHRGTGAFRDYAVHGLKWFRLDQPRRIEEPSKVSDLRVFQFSHS